MPHVSEETTLHPLTRELLATRGVVEEDDIERFLNPRYDEHLHDPFLLSDMDKAVSRILIAIKNEEKILVYTDYDTDGIPAGVILHDFFKKIGFKNFENYIPHRHKEGYGLNKPAIERFARDGVELLITADCGITDNEEVALAESLGITTIVTDHHLPGETLPPAYAVLNPNKKGETYPFSDLCGCAVAFKLISALIKQGKKEGYFSIEEGWEKWLLDMVGLSTIADMVSLTGENRVLAYYGLKVLRRSPRPGLVNLLQKARIPQPSLIEDDVGFGIGPRINAASRMDVPRRAFEMLTTRDEAEAIELVSFLESLNRKRKGLVASMLKEARIKLSEREVREVIVLGSTKWQPGLLGLVANNLAEEYDRPTFLWGRGEDGATIKGSCRSNGSINIVECMRKATDSFLDFGGHRESGGFSVGEDKIHLLEDALLDAYGQIEKSETHKEEKKDVDGELALHEVNWDTHRNIERLAPFGMGNPRPLFLFKDSIIEAIRSFGKGQEHRELMFRDKNGRKVSAIAFFVHKDRIYQSIEEGITITFTGYMERNIFMGKNELRLRIIEIV